MTKEEIINAHYAHPYMKNKDDAMVSYTYDKDAIREMLDTYANQQCLAFAQWIQSHGFKGPEDMLTLVHNDWYLESDKDGDQPITTEEIYTQFLNQQT